MARYQFSLRSLLVFTTLLIVIIGVASTLLQRHTEASKRRDTFNWFRTIWYSLAKNDHAYGCLPLSCARDANGRAMSSWRFNLLYEMGGPFGEWDLPWNDPANKNLVESSLGVYCFGSLEGAIESRCITNVMAVCGPGAPFDDKHRHAVAGLDPDTILIVETTTSRTHWMQPGGDLDVSNLPTAGDCASAGISGSCRGGFFVGFADGEIWILSNRTPLAVLRKFFTAKRSNSESRDELLAPYRISLE